MNTRNNKISLYDFREKFYKKVIRRDFQIFFDYLPPHMSSLLYSSFIQKSIELLSSKPQSLKFLI